MSPPFLLASPHSHCLKLCRPCGPSRGLIRGGSGGGGFDGARDEGAVAVRDRLPLSAANATDFVTAVAANARTPQCADGEVEDRDRPDASGARLFAACQASQPEAGAGSVYGGPRRRRRVCRRCGRRRVVRRPMIVVNCGRIAMGGDD